METIAVRGKDKNTEELCCTKETVFRKGIVVSLFIRNITS
jgi:hypothetical protein